MRAILLAFLLLSLKANATGFAFYEHTAKSSSLAASNFALSNDASEAFNLPAAMSNKDGRTITVSANHYKVQTSYKFVFLNYEESAENIIPSFFSRTKLTDKLQLGISIASRYAAEIQLPAIPLIMPSVKGRPIVVSLAPSISYNIKDNLSIGFMLEYALLQYEAQISRCTFCTFKSPKIDYKGDKTKYIPSLSLYYRPLKDLHLGFNYKPQTILDNEEIELSIPHSFHFYSSYSLLKSFNLHLNITKTLWEDQGVVFTDYPDHFGLFKTNRNSDRVGVGLEYNYRKLNLNLGYSVDEAVDKLGGIDQRYRFGLGFNFSKSITTNLSYTYEDYARKEEGDGLVVILNKGQSTILSITYNN